LLNEVFGFLNPHSLLRSDSIEIDMDKFEKMYTDDVNFTELRGAQFPGRRITRGGGGDE